MLHSALSWRSHRELAVDAESPLDPDRRLTRLSWASAALTSISPPSVFFSDSVLSSTCFHTLMNYVPAQPRPCHLHKRLPSSSEMGAAVLLRNLLLSPWNPRV